MKPILWIAISASARELIKRIVHYILYEHRLRQIETPGRAGYIIIWWWKLLKTPYMIQKGGIERGEEGKKSNLVIHSHGVVLLQRIIIIIIIFFFNFSKMSCGLARKGISKVIVVISRGGVRGGRCCGYIGHSVSRVISMCARKV